MAENFICDPRLLLNMTENNTLFLVNAGGCCPDWTTYLPTFIIIGFFLLCLYMAETRRDIGFALFMMAISIFAFGDTILSSISATNGDITINFPLLMTFISVYEVGMTLLLINELQQRKKNGGIGDSGNDGE